MKFVYSFRAAPAALSFVLLGNAIAESYDLARSCDVRHELCGLQRVVLPDEPHQHSGVTLLTSSLVVSIATSTSAGTFFRVY